MMMMLQVAHLHVSVMTAHFPVLLLLHLLHVNLVGTSFHIQGRVRTGPTLQLMKVLLALLATLEKALGVLRLAIRDGRLG